MRASVAAILLLGQDSLAFQSNLPCNAGTCIVRPRNGPKSISTITNNNHGSTTRTTSLNLGDFFNFSKQEAKQEKPSTGTAKTEQATTTTPEEEEDYYDEDDPIEKIFNVFFGKKEKAPMGMARFGQSKFPEQYPATLDTWADPVETDDKEMAILRQFLKNTNLETRGLKLTYDANRDGWDPVKFHEKVDKLGGGIVYCTTRAGIQCGGYNPKGVSVFILFCALRH